MAINMSTQVYGPSFDVFARPATFNPTVSQPLAGTYGGRGYYGTMPIDVLAENNSVLSDQRTFLDVRDSEFTVMPQQGDRVVIPANSGMPAEGEFEIIDLNANGGGLTTLILRKWMASIP